MSLVLDTGAMKYRESPSQPWRPLVIKAGMNWESMADTYDPDNGTYEVGQYVLEEGMMYRCIYEITTPEAWTPAHWTSANVADELASFIIISDDQPTEDSNKIWIAETTSPFGVQIPTMDDHNALGNTLNHLEDGLAIIVNGDTCSTAVPVGGYAYIKNNTHGLVEGLYTNTSASAFPTSGGTATSSVFTPVSGGGLNRLKNSIDMFIKHQKITISATGSFGEAIISEGVTGLNEAYDIILYAYVSTKSNWLVRPYGYHRVQILDITDGSLKANQQNVEVDVYYH